MVPTQLALPPASPLKTSWLAWLIQAMQAVLLICLLMRLSQARLPILAAMQLPARRKIPTTARCNVVVLGQGGRCLESSPSCC